MRKDIFLTTLFNSLVAQYFATSRRQQWTYVGKIIKLMFAIISISLLNDVASSTVTTATVFQSTATTPYSSAVDTFPKLTSYQTAVARARCQVRCNAKFGVKKMGMPQEFSEMYRPFVCAHKHSICQQCSSQCNIPVQKTKKCREHCTTEICLESCLFLNTTLYQEEESSGTSVLPAPSKMIMLTTPVPACLYTPVPQDNDTRGSTVVLKWNVLWPNGQAVSVPISFVVEMKELKENGHQTEWQVLGYTNFSVIPIIKLDTSSGFKFRVSAVTQESLLAKPVSTELIRFSPAVPLQPPQNVSVVKQYIRGYTLRAEVQWSIPNYAGCYFKLYWMTPKKGSFHSRELKEWMGFKCELNNLDFDSDYKLEIQTYDRFFKIPSEKVSIDFSTPSCLRTTNYDYHSCAPDAPVDISANITEPYEVNKFWYTNVTLTWKPPKHVSWHNTIDKYVISWRKTPDIRFTQLIPPDRRVIYIDGETTEWTMVYVHWDSEYIANIAAESKGGLGEKATLKIVTGKGYSQLVSEESHAADTTNTSNKVYYVTIIPTLTMAVIIAVCALFYFRLRKNIPHLEHEGPIGKEEINPLYERTVTTAAGEGEPLLPNDKYEVDYCCLKFTDLLGEGAFGKVHKAEFTPPDQRGAQTSSTRTVAVKMLKEHATAEEKRFLLLEIGALKSLGSHPHLVSIVACVTDIEKPCLIMDYCPLGDLRKYLREHRKQVQYWLSVNPTSNSLINGVNAVDSTTSSHASTKPGSKTEDSLNVDTSETLSQVSLLSYARQIAIGMEYLNQNRFIHRDLASRNILMSSHEVVKISDFGLSRDVYETNVYQPTSGRRLPYKWMSIESIFDQIFTIKSDVWSYGILLWEITTLGGCPYPGIPDKDLFRLLKEGYRLARPNNCSPDLYKIMLSCWHPSPDDRPSFTQLKKKMESLLEDTCSYIDLIADINEDYYTKSSTGHELEDTESQRNDPSSGSEETKVVELHLSDTNEIQKIHRGSGVNTSICHRYFPFGASGTSLNRSLSKSYVHYPNSSYPYAFDNNEPVPGLSEELLQQTHSSARQETTALNLGTTVCDPSINGASTIGCTCVSTKSANGDAAAESKCVICKNWNFCQNISNNNCCNPETMLNTVVSSKWKKLYNPTFHADGYGLNKASEKCIPA